MLSIGLNQAVRWSYISRNPAALDSHDYLTGTSGATLDPIFALGQEVKLNAHESAEVAFLTLAGESREEVLAFESRLDIAGLVAQGVEGASLETFDFPVGAGPLRPMPARAARGGLPGR